jgi:hypothetical protein
MLVSYYRFVSCKYSGFPPAFAIFVYIIILNGNGKTATAKQKCLKG